MTVEHRKFDAEHICHTHILVGGEALPYQVGVESGQTKDRPHAEEANHDLEEGEQ